MSHRLLPRVRAAPPDVLLRVGGLAALAVVVVLLLGGRGTLASWRIADDVDPGDAGTGVLRLDTDATNTGCGGWAFSGSAVRPDGPYTGQLLAPGDVLTRACRFTLRAGGDHLTGIIATSVGPGSPALPDGVVLTVAD